MACILSVSETDKSENTVGCASSLSEFSWKREVGRTDSVLDELYQLRSGRSICLDAANQNRYTIVVKENDHTKTAYCFSVPVRRAVGMMTERRFRHQGRTAFYTGSNAAVILDDSIRFQNAAGACRAVLPGTIFKRTENAVDWGTQPGTIQMTPTANGLLLRMPCTAQSVAEFRLTAEQPYHSVRVNGQLFAWMKEEFTPLISASCIGTLNGKHAIIGPCRLRHQKLSDREYRLTLTHRYPSGKDVLVELNMHEAKLFQDTTVESLHPAANNAFGGTAYLGTTTEYGEQWLYSRLEFSLLPELQRRRIFKAVLHLPDLNHTGQLLEASRTASRFCSFGSNWDHKIAVAEPLCQSVNRGGYYHLDLSELVRQFDRRSGNFVIRAIAADRKAAAVPTADSFHRPQILEINYL